MAHSSARYEECFLFMARDLRQSICIAHGFVVTTHPDYVCLSPSVRMFGLSKPRAWFQQFTCFITGRFSAQPKLDRSPFLYFIAVHDISFLLLYVYDLFLRPPSKHYTRYHYSASRTPVDTESKLGSDGDPVSDPTFLPASGWVLFSNCLSHAAWTSPFACILRCVFYMHATRAPHFTALKRILRYVRGTLTFGLQIHASTTAQLTAYTDADWAGCPVTRRSTSGYCVFLGDNFVRFQSDRLPYLSSSAEERSIAVFANVVAGMCGIRICFRDGMTLYHSYSRLL
ncbi:ribonuclease H-like domain-containing protein [Tanacetum coccineum]|uniref:Ribonuclease H-like domain-containing protein n=1 Tax=Tanacetum coccineum TaxID=301880 RepID=A0ABQ5J426_9ASTR